MRSHLGIFSEKVDFFFPSFFYKLQVYTSLRCHTFEKVCLKGVYVYDEIKAFINMLSLDVQDLIYAL